MSVPEALIEAAARRFALLSDPTRLRILSLLLDQGGATVTELAAALDLAVPNVSQHLGRLLSARVVRRERQGKMARYSVSEPGLRPLCELVSRSLREQTERLLADRAAAG